MTFNEALQKLNQVKYLEKKGLIKPFNTQINDIIIGPANVIALRSFVTEWHRTKNENILNSVTLKDFRLYVVFNTPSLDICPLETVIDTNKSHPDFRNLDPLSY